MGHYIIFEFHKLPLTEKIMLRNFQYIANFRTRVKQPVSMEILSLDETKSSVRSVEIMPDWFFKPNITFLIDLDGDEILSIIKDKLEHNIDLTDMGAYLFSVIPFTKHKKDTVELVDELCHFVNETNIPQVYKYIIKLSQILWVQALIKDEEHSNELMDVIKMRSTFIQNYEKNLVETAVDKAIKDAMEVIRTKGNGTAHEIDENESIRAGILEKTGVDIRKI